MKEEIPNTEQGLILYIAYCERQIKENGLANNRLRKRIEVAGERLTKMKGELNAQ